METKPKKPKYQYFYKEDPNFFKGKEISHEPQKIDPSQIL